jgi:hypothetical protein
MKQLQQCCHFLLKRLLSFFTHIHLTHINAAELEALHGIFLNMAIETGCLDLTLSWVTYQEAPHHSSVSCKCKKKSSINKKSIYSLEGLSLTCFHLTVLQWGDSSSHLHMPSFSHFEIWDSSSMISIFNFLL